MKVYRHELKGSRVAVLLGFSLILLVLNVLILPGGEDMPVKIFTAGFTVLWLAFTVDSLTAKTVTDEDCISIYSLLFKKSAPWKDICEIDFGQRWVMGTFMPEHVIVSYKSGNDQKTCTMTLHKDIKGWKDLLGDIVCKAPPDAIPPKIKQDFSR